MKIHVKKHFSLIWPSLLYIVSFIFFLFHFEQKYELSDLNLLLKILSVMVVFILIPPLILHIRYYFLNKNISINYDAKKQTFSIMHKVSNKKINLPDVVHVEIHTTYAVANDSIRIFPSNSYYYGIIKLNSGDEFIITTLLDTELLNLKEFFKSKLIYKERIWCFI